MIRPLPTPVEIDDGALYRKAPTIHPREVDGRYARLRVAAVFALLGLFYGLPWLSWNGRQAVLFDLPARRFSILGLEFWPQDFVYLALLLIAAGLSLFFFTALAGRLWCGYACPQTVWTEVFLWIERRCEGDRAARIKLDAAPWSARKLTRRGGKHLAWMVLALWTGYTFVGFFTPIRTLGAELLSFSTGPWETFWVGFYAFATWGNAGFLREQVCQYMCPYARFQGAMFDRDTLIIAYDSARGEPRRRGRRSAPARKSEPRLRAEPQPVPSPARRGGGVAVDLRSTSSLIEAGDCIDCTMCVQVCPTGIDIRDGLQYECIACGACIDACDEVMARVGLARGLIRYTSENALEGRRTRVLRPRVLIYGTLLLVLLSGIGVSIATRTPLRVDVIRDRNALWRETGDGAIENAYTLKLINQDSAPRRFRVVVEGPAQPLVPIEATVAASDVLALPVTLRASPGTARGVQDVRFVVTRSDDSTITRTASSRFFGPTP